MEIMKTIFLAAFILSGVVLVVLILLRKSDVGGLSGAFGGMGDAAFGVKAQKGLDKIITWLAVAFVCSAIFLNLPIFRAEHIAAPTPASNTQAPENPTPSTPAQPTEPGK